MLKIILASLMLISSSAYAGFLIEPYAGYLSAKHSGKWDNYGTSLDLPSEKGTGAAYGARVGYGQGMFGAALDYMTTSTLKEEHKQEGTLTNIGLVGMVGLPFVRVWAGYIFSSTFKFDMNDSTADVKGEEKGSGTKFGIGFNPIPFFSVNFEYMMLNFDKESYKDFQDTTRKTNAFLLSLSFPFTFG